MQSFGTEGRPAAEYVAPSSEKYECIIFKGETCAHVKRTLISLARALTLNIRTQLLHLQSCAGADIKDLTVLDQQPPEGYISTPAQVRPPTPLSKLSHDFLLQ